MLTIYGARTRRLWPHLVRTVAASRSEGKRCLVFVPEQYTLQAEQDLIRDLKIPGFFDIEVASFSRFVQRLFDQYSEGHTRIDDNGKNIALAQALLSKQKKLLYYDRASKRRGFISQGCGWIAAMKQASLDPDRLQEYALSLPDGNYKEKILDLSLLYSTYSNILTDKYVDGEDVLDRVIRILPLSDALKNTAVFVFGFDIITDDFARFLAEASVCCENCCVYLDMDREDAPDGDCFLPVRSSAERLRTYLRENHIKREWIWLENAPVNAPEEIRYLEKNLLRASSAACQCNVSHISLFEAANPFSEAQEIAQHVTLLLRGGTAPEKICVLCGNLKNYSAVLQAEMESYGIPCYVAAKEPLLYHGVSRMLLSGLRCVANGYRREDALSLLKSGYAPLSQEMCWSLENYVLRYGINGKRWHMPFTRGNDTERYLPEEARLKLIPILEELQNNLKTAKTAGESLQAVMRFLTVSDVVTALSEQDRRLSKLGLEDAVLRNTQIWARLLSVFDQLYEISTGARIPARSLISLLEAGLMENGISSLPPAAGFVYVGQIGNLIPSDPIAVFACGMDSSMDSSEEDGLLSEDETQSVCMDLNLYPSIGTDDKNLLSELHIWKALSSPTQELHLSYSRATISGISQRASQTVLTVKRLFPALPVYGSISDTQGTLFPLAPEPALSEIGLRIRTGNMNKSWHEAWKWLVQSPEYGRMAQRILQNLRGEHKEEETIDPKLARKLFNQRIVSISRLESYAQCPYSHFVEYGLKPLEQKEWGVNTRDAGVFYHAAMEGFTRILPENSAWPNIGRKECDRIMSAALKPLTEQWADSAFVDNARSRAEARRYISICKRVAWVFTRGARESRFRPSEMEVAFGYPGGPPAIPLDLQDGTRVLVRGRIDRIDQYDSGESIYLRVVDYKSGEQKLDPAKIQAGMQLQLLLYLEAALNCKPGTLPAGAFYQWMGDPLIDQDKKKNIEQELAKRLCLKGLVLNDVQVLEWMDRSVPPVSIEEVLKKDGTPRSSKLVCTLDEIRMLIKTAHNTAVHLTEEIRKGDIRVSPVAEKTNIVRCRYCSFAGVCRRDAQTVPVQRPLPNVKLADLLNGK